MSNHEIKIRTERESATYKRNELIVFQVSMPDVSPEASIGLQYELQFDRVRTLASGVMEAGANPVEVRTEAREPGFYNLKVSFNDTTAEAAAEVEPENIRPSVPCPDDFSDFWKQKKAALAAVPVNLKIKNIPPIRPEAYREWNANWPVFGNRPVKHEDIKTYEFEADNISGNPAKGYCALPAGAKPKSLPALLFTHGAGFRGSDFAKACAGAKHGFLTMDINAHGLGKFDSPDCKEEFVEEITNKYGRIYRKGRFDKNTVYLAEMYLRHRRALDVLCSMPEWDGRTLIVRGASQGGCLALACAGLDERVTAICAGIPANCDTNHEFPLRKWFLDPGDSEEDIARIREAIRYVSMANFAKDINAEAYFTVAWLDTSCPPSTVYAAYNAYAGPKRIFAGPEADHSGIPNRIHYDDFTKFTLEHIEKIRNE